jgi:hypothetical protein
MSCFMVAFKAGLEHLSPKKSGSISALLCSCLVIIRSSTYMDVASPPSSPATQPLRAMPSCSGRLMPRATARAVAIRDVPPVPPTVQPQNIPFCFASDISHIFSLSLLSSALIWPSEASLGRFSRAALAAFAARSRSWLFTVIHRIFN